MLNSATAISAVREQLQHAKQQASNGDANITVEEITGFSSVQAAAWADTLSQTENAVIQLAGATEPPGFGRVSVGEKASLIRIEPLKFWMISAGIDRSGAKPGAEPSTEPGAESSAAPADSLLNQLSKLEADTFCVLDLSHSRTWLRISGHQAGALLNHFLPIDLRTNHFPLNSVVSTAFHHIGITLWKSELGFELLLPRSFAASLTELLLNSARRYGLDIVLDSK